MTDTQTAIAWRGYEMIDRDGDRIGRITEIYLDQQTNEPEWATVKTGLFGTRQTFVPIRDATSEGEIVRVPFEKGHVKDAPNVDADQELSQSEERELYEHYGIDYSQSRSGSQLPEPGGEPGQEPPSGSGVSGAGGEAEAAGAGGGSADAPASADATAGREPGRATAGTGGAPADSSGTAEGGRGEGDLGTTERGERGESGEGERETFSTRDEAPLAGADDPDRVERPGEPDRTETGADEERAPAPDEGERGVAVPGESDDDDAGGDLSTTTQRISEEPANAPGEGETRLRLKKYVVTEEVRVPVQRTEVRVERDDE
jgi:hypothetical protein